MGTIALAGDTTFAKVTLTITFNPAVTVVSVTRVHPDGSSQVIRSGAKVVLSGGTATIDDYEVPLDVAVHYEAAQVTPAGTETATSAGITICGYGRSFLRDPAVPSHNMLLQYVESLIDTTRVARAGIFDIVDRPQPIVVSTRRQSWAGDLTLWTYTDAERVQLETLLGRGQVLLFSTAPDYGVGNAYVHVGDVTCSRLPTIGREQTRHWTLPLVEVDRPATLPVMPAAMRWQDVLYNWATWQDLKASGLTWQQLMDYTP